MVGVKWNGSLLAAAAWAGLALAQSASPYASKQPPAGPSMGVPRPNGLSASGCVDLSDTVLPVSQTATAPKELPVTPDGAVPTVKPAAAQPAAPADMSGHRIITVQQPGKPPEQCWVINSWRESNGNVALEVQSIRTGERMTVVTVGESSYRAGMRPGSVVQSMRTKIYHWTRNTTPPPGAPVAPETSLASAQSMNVPASSYRRPILTRARSTPPPLPEARPSFPGVKPAVPPPAQPLPVSTVPAVASKEQKEVPAQPVKREKAPASDWHKSWGKPDAEDHKSKLPPQEDLPTAKKSEVDPLTAPERYNPEAVAEAGGKESTKTDSDKKDADVKQDKKATVVKKPAGPKPKKSLFGVIAAALTGEEKAKPKKPELTPEMMAELRRRQNPMATGSMSPAPGAGSVLASGNNQYVPVPLVTAPPMTHMPMPPRAQIPQPPQPPQPIVEVANAFTNVRMMPNGGPVPAQGAEEEEVPPDQANAFSKPGVAGRSTPQRLQMQNMQRAMMMHQQPATPGSYPGMRGPIPQPPSAPIMAARYQQQQMQQQQMAAYQMAMAQRAAAMQAQLAAQRGYGDPRQAMMPQQQMPQQQAMMPRQGMPNHLPPPSAVRQVGYDVQQMMLVLRNSLWPSHREWAAEQLSHQDWRQQPVVVQALMQGAQNDPAPTVRAACVRCIGKMNVNTISVVQTLQEIKLKEDPLVAMEVDSVLLRFVGQQAAAARQPAKVQQTGATNEQPVQPVVEDKPAEETPVSTGSAPATVPVVEKVVDQSGHEVQPVPIVVPIINP